MSDPVLEMVPPPHMWEWVGEPRRFVKVGRAMFDYMVEHAELTPASAVLDVGCGIGKHAIHFAPYLQSPGFYEGFDVDERSIGYCREVITARYPHIRFRHVDVQSDMYSPSAGRTASEFCFPYADGTFDFVFLASVFSHMFLADVAHYVSEIVRVLKPGGRMLATGYFLGDEQRAGIDAGTAAFSFGITHSGSFIERAIPADSAVAQPRDEFVALIQQHGLAIEKVRNGIWHTNAIQDQDFVLARKAVFQQEGLFATMRSLFQALQRPRRTR